MKHPTRSFPFKACFETLGTVFIADAMCVIQEENTENIFMGVLALEYILVRFWLSEAGLRGTAR